MTRKHLLVSGRRRGLQLLETIRALLARHEGPMLPLGLRLTSRPSHPIVRGFFVGSSETIPGPAGYRREGCNPFSLHGPGGLLTYSAMAGEEVPLRSIPRQASTSIRASTGAPPG